KYLSIEGRPLSKENESIVYFYKGQKFIPHVKRLLRYGNITVEITVLPSFGANGRSRKEICRLCRDMITQRLDEATPLRGAATL
ncbi:MAG: hypothetical protein LBI67_10200, partial [Treponema sp.]|nr:hypothetical protein [Treponema sp.]